MPKGSSESETNGGKDPASLRDGYRTTFEQNLTYSVPDDEKKDFVPVTLEVASTEYKSYMHAVHGMIYCFGECILWDRYKQSGQILMQMRCDGMVGFPGGLMDQDYDEPIVDCLNREMAEEINLDLEKYKFLQSDYLLSHVNHRKKLVTHFYIHQVTEVEIREIEFSTLKAKDWGHETFGTIRVPLFAMDDGFRGFPVFLANRFAGNARDQLLQGIVKCGLLSQKECDVYVKSFEEYIKRPHT